MVRALILSLSALASTAGGDPAGTVVLSLEVGQLAKVTVSQPGARVVCDDPTVVVPEYPAGKGPALRALKPGSTLCGVRLVKDLPGGLYRVNVSKK